jgi:PAP2 superfamily
MSLNKNKNKNKNKSFNKTGSTFPANGWDPWMETVAELPNFFEIQGWRDLPLDPPPGPARTRVELDDLLAKQAEMETSAVRDIRRPEIELEARADTPFYQRVLTPTPSGSFAATSVLIDAMSHLGTVVGCYYKKKFMRPRPSQLEPRLRPAIDVPAHAAYPSGHSLQNFLIAQALATVVQSDELTIQLSRIAQRVAENREYAGLHYESDTIAGRRLATLMFPMVLDAYRETFQTAAREWL